MTKKKKSIRAAKLLSPKDAIARERVDRVWAARHVADLIRSARSLRQRAAKATGRDRADLLHYAKNFESLVTNFIFFWKDPADFVQMVLDALDGKRLGARYDDLLIKALIHADRKARDGTKGLNPFIRATPEQIDNALNILSGRGQRPTKRAGIRRLENLGYY
jgi:hypothetical protein